MRLIASALILASLASPALAKPPLRDVAKIDNGLMAIAIADEIRKECDDIKPRMIRALSQLNTLKGMAKEMGYSEEEIDDYVNSKAEKTRMRQKAETWLAGQGVDAKDTRALCAFGKADIARGGPVGSFLR
jgi:S-adenosylmethionine synthetase